jgi:hypothetical protein
MSSQVVSILFRFVKLFRFNTTLFPMLRIARLALFVGFGQDIASLLSHLRFLFSGNRDRGDGHPSSPPTPPDMRVRIRRFGGLS